MPFHRRYNSSAMFKRQPKRWPAKKKHDPRFPLNNKPSRGVLQIGDRISPPIVSKQLTLRNAYPDNIVGGGTSFNGFGFLYNLSTLDNVTTFLGLFDQYRIDYIEVQFRPAFNVAATSSSGVTQLITTVVDYDDASVPTGPAQLHVFNSCETNSFETFTRAWQPHTGLGTIAGSSGVGYANVASPWIDCANPTVPHFGLKIGINAGSASFLQSWNLTTYLWVTFRNVR